MHTDTPKYRLRYIYTYVHTYIHTYMYTHTFTTYIHTHYIISSIKFLSNVIKCYHIIL